MNWYKKASTGRRLETVARRITIAVMNAFKNKEITLHFNMGEIQINVDFIYEFHNNYKSPYLGVTGTFSTNTLRLNIFYNYHYDPSSKLVLAQLENLYFKILETCRHELEHYMQEIDGRSMDNYLNPRDLNDSRQDPNPIIRFVNYVIQPDEIEAFSSGFYLRAKKSGLSFKQVAENYLTRQLFILEHRHPNSAKNLGGLTVKGLMDQTVNKLYNYAKIRYNLKEFNS